MIIAFIAFGILAGGAAAVTTLLIGGAFLTAFVAYAGVGALAMMVPMALCLWSATNRAEEDWADAKDRRDAVSA